MARGTHAATSDKPITKAHLKSRLSCAPPRSSSLSSQISSLFPPVQTPLLLIHFNRPDITQRALAALKPLAPSQVWILCDAAREHRPEEASKVAEVRAQLDALPWPCEVRRLYREDNLGCFRNISDGISWFLKDCGGEGIILEDDCIADSSFFTFCSELLERHRDDPTVMAISGHTGRNKPFDINESYALSQYFGCWGWATWQSAWERFDPDLSGWTERRQWRSICTRVLPSRWARIYWHLMFKRVADGRRDSWAYRYLLSIWTAKGTVVFPKWNLVRNIGSGIEATHSGQADQAELPIERMPFPLQHPVSVSANKTIDQFLEGHVHSKSLRVRVRWFFRKFFNKS